MGIAPVYRSCRRAAGKRGCILTRKIKRSRVGESSPKPRSIKIGRMEQARKRVGTQLKDVRENRLGIYRRAARCARPSPPLSYSSAIKARLLKVIYRRRWLVSPILQANPSWLPCSSFIRSLTGTMLRRKLISFQLTTVRNERHAFYELIIDTPRY